MTRKGWLRQELARAVAAGAAAEVIAYLALALRPRRRTPEERVQALEAKLLELSKYTDGQLGGTLGERPSTPCVLSEDRKVKRAVMRMVKAACLGPRPPGAMVCHRCDDPRCVRPDHLFWGTGQDNRRDCVLKGRGGRSFQEIVAGLQARLERLRGV